MKGKVGCGQGAQTTLSDCSQPVKEGGFTAIKSYSMVFPSPQIRPHAATTQKGNRNGGKRIFLKRPHVPQKRSFVSYVEKKTYRIQPEIGG